MWVVAAGVGISALNLYLGDGVVGWYQVGVERNPRNLDFFFFFFNLNPPAEG